MLHRAAALAWGDVDGDAVQVVCLGGTLTVRPGHEHYTLSGPAEYVFEGRLPAP